MRKHYIFLKYGLANRLRTIAGFLYIYIVTGREFIFHWDIEQKDCNGNFNDIFEPIIINRGRICIEDRAHDCSITYHFIGQNTISDTLKLEMPGQKFNVTKVEDMIYKYFIPKQTILRKIQSFQYARVAIHIRRTDHVSLAQKNNCFISDDEFIKYIEENRGENIFLATDDSRTQQKFLKYKNIIIYKEIRGRDFRQTSLEDAVIDAFIAGAADKFMGSKYSSFSNLIKIIARGRIFAPEVSLQ